MRNCVMVVEDDPNIEDVLQKALEYAGYEVLLAHDGLDALEQLQTVVPDLILLDIFMPRMNGFEFLHELDRRGMRSAFPVIVLSAHMTTEELERWHVFDFFQKPFSLKRLLETVRQCLPSPNPQIEKGRF